MQKLTPPEIHERWTEKFCPHCNAKLSLMERYMKKRSVRIPCKCCGQSIPSDMILIGNTKFPKGMIMKRF